MNNNIVFGYGEDLFFHQYFDSIDMIEWDGVSIITLLVSRGIKQYKLVITFGGYEAGDEEMFSERQYRDIVQQISKNEHPIEIIIDAINDDWKIESM